MEIDKIPEGLKNLLGVVVLNRKNEKEIKHLLKRMVPQFKSYIRDTKREREGYDWESDEDDRESIEEWESFIRFIEGLEGE